MNLKKWEAVIYPLTVWLTFKIIAFLFGFSSWPDIAQLALFGETYPFVVALGFGIWIGVASQESFTLFETIRNAAIIAIVVGFVELLLTIILINSSPSFVNYALSVYPAEANMDIPLANLVVSTWIGGIFTIIPASAGIYLLSDKLSSGKKRK